MLTLLHKLPCCYRIRPHREARLNIRTIATSLALATLCAASIPAQSAVRLRVDNDAFNFWQPPWNRPDEEFSSGVRLSVDYAGPAFWMKRGGVAEHTWTLGQDIFTAARTALQPTPPPGSRPDAGLLFLQNQQRVARLDRLEETSLTLGVTGEPSLASSTQRIVHGFTADWQRPIDWSHQLPFEPKLNVAYDQTRRRGSRAVEVNPHAGGSLGNLLTEVRAGIGARTGWNLSHPWMSATPQSRVAFDITTDATLRAVAWNGTLSGDTFRSSQHVTLRPFVREYQLGFSARVDRATVAYVVNQRSAEYTTRSAAHQWSSLQTQWQFAW
ncbi:MAG: lipid A deacylase LpxR family protein [bacterium]